MALAALETRIFPPALALAAGVGIWRLPRYPALSALPALPLRPIAGILAAAAFYLHVDALIRLRRARTQVSPFTPAESSALVRDGVFARSRNPMYLSLAIYLLAWSAWCAAPGGVPVVAAFVGYITAFQIVPEERAMGKFEEFEEYCREVRRWV